MAIIKQSETFLKRLGSTRPTSGGKGCGISDNYGSREFKVLMKIIMRRTSAAELENFPQISFVLQSLNLLRVVTNTSESS